MNIIDTPGFGDTRGKERDSAIIDQIKQLFSAPGEQGVLYIDSVCFIAKAPDARLTIVQKYMFDSIISLFGKDIESNICTLITFADGGKPPILASLEESKLPFGQYFTFNNSALYAENNVEASQTFSPLFWEMGCRSFKQFFQCVEKLNTKSLCQTKDVFEEREQLRTIITNVQPQVSAGLSKLSELNQHLIFCKAYNNEIEANENFEYTVEETRQEMIDLPKGQHVTICLHCNVTCHERCMIKDDENKMKCLAMDKEGNCRVCSGHCIWSEHKNIPYMFKFFTETVTKTYSDMKGRYEKAMGEKLTKEKYIEKLSNDKDVLFEHVSEMMNEMNRCKTRLKEIAFKPDPLSTVEHIDLMIVSEEKEKQPGHFNRIKMLEELKRISLIDKDIEIFIKHFKDTKESKNSLVGISSKEQSRNKSGILKRFNNVF